MPFPNHKILSKVTCSKKKLRELQLRPISPDSIFVSKEEEITEQYQKDFFATTKMAKLKDHVSYEEISHLLQILQKNAENSKNWEILVFCHLVESTLSHVKNIPLAELSETEKNILGDFLATMKTYNNKFQKDNNYSEVEKIRNFLPRSTSREHNSVFGSREHPHLSQRIWQYVPNFSYNVEALNQKYE